MILLIILAVVLAILAIILTAYVRVEVGYGKNGPNLTVRFLFFSYRIFGGKKKKLKKRDFKIGRFRRRKKRVMKKYRVKTKEKKPKKKRAHTEKQSLKKRVEDIYLSFEEALKAFPKALKIRFKSLEIAVGGKDAHDMALNYGYVIQGVQYVISVLGSYTCLYTDKNSSVAVYPAFSDGKWKADADIEVKIRTISGIRLGLSFLKGYLRYKKRRAASMSVKNADATA